MACLLLALPLHLTPFVSLIASVFGLPSFFRRITGPALSLLPSRYIVAPYNPRSSQFVLLNAVSSTIKSAGQLAVFEIELSTHC